MALADLNKEIVFPAPKWRGEETKLFFPHLFASIRRALYSKRALIHTRKSIIHYSYFTRSGPTLSPSPRLWFTSPDFAVFSLSFSWANFFSLGRLPLCEKKQHFPIWKSRIHLAFLSQGANFRSRSNLHLFHSGFNVPKLHFRPNISLERRHIKLQLWDMRSRISGLCNPFLGTRATSHLAHMIPFLSLIPRAENWPLDQKVRLNDGKPPFVGG